MFFMISWDSSQPTTQRCKRAVVGYAVSLKKRLTVLDDKKYRAPTSRTENKIHPFVIRGKNQIFFDTAHGAESSAIIRSLIETARENGPFPKFYLIDLIKNKHLIC